MSSDHNFLVGYRVPKIKTETIQNLPLDDPQRKFLISKIEESYKRPDLSKVSMKFHQAWSITNIDSRSSYSKKRAELKTIFKSTEYYGFVYVKSEYELKKIVKEGNIKVHNVPVSYLGKCEMGVSLSQHADISNPEFYKSGIILVVNYMRGQVNYVLYDSSPMDPQPKYDCHMLRQSLTVDSSTTPHKAFHSTQVFLYEYSEDCEIVPFPSQITIIGAVKFSWHGPSICKEISKIRTPTKSVTEKNPVKRIFEASSKSPPAKRPLINPSKSLMKSNSFPESELLSATLILGKSSSYSHPDLNLNVKLISRLEQPINLSNLMFKKWNLLELLENRILHEYLYYTENSVRRTLSFNPKIINKLPHTINDRKKLGATFRPKYALYFKMIPSSSKEKKMQRIMENLALKNMVGVVRCNSLNNMLFYIIPNGSFSMSIGLPSIDAENSHVIIFTEQHPQFLPCNYSSYDKDIKKEQKIFQEIISDYESKIIKPKQILLLDLLINVKKPIASSSHNKHDSDMDIDSEGEPNLESSKQINFMNFNHKKNPIQINLGPKSKTLALVKSHTLTSSIVNRSPVEMSPVNQPHLTKPLHTVTPSNQISPRPHITKSPQIVDTQALHTVSKPPVQTINTPLPNGISASNTTDFVSETPVVNYKPKSFGRFKLMEKQASGMYKPDNKRTSRRQVHLDSVIFSKISGYSHISLYNGQS